MHLIFLSSESFCACFWFICWISIFDHQNIKETIIHIFHSLLHGDTVVSDNGILLFFSIFQFLFRKYRNITYQYLHYFSFNNCNFRFTHIYTSSLTNIIYLFVFYHTPPTNFTVERQAPKDRPCNKERKKEELSTKIPFVSRGD